MKPPIPTQPVEKKNNSRWSRLVPMIAALLGVIVLAVVLAYEDHDTPPGLLPAAGAPGVPGGIPGAGIPGAAYPGRWWGDGLDDYASLGPDELFRMMPSDEPMDTEPADLPAFTPSDHEPAPVREEAFRRAANGIVEEFASWWLPGASFDYVQKFYHDAVIQHGFSLVPHTGHRSHPSPLFPAVGGPSASSEYPTTRPAPMHGHRSNQIYIRKAAREDPAAPPRTEVVVVRLWSDENKGVHVFLWYRYPTYSHVTPGNVPETPSEPGRPGPASGSTAPGTIPATPGATPQP